MSQFQKAKESIDKDVEQIFQEIYTEIKVNYLTTVNDDLMRLRKSMNHGIPSIVDNKKLLLLDTTLNYLTDDAIRVLEMTNSKAANFFYRQNQGWRDQIKSESQHFRDICSVSSSPDPRFMYGATLGAGVFTIGGIIGRTMLSLEFPVLLPLVIASGLGVATLTYQKTTSLAMKRIEEDIKEYLLV